MINCPLGMTTTPPPPNHKPSKCEKITDLRLRQASLKANYSWPEMAGNRTLNLRSKDANDSVEFVAKFYPMKAKGKWVLF